MLEIAQKLYQLVQPNQPVLFVCIGTDRSTGDAYGPLVGTELSQLGIPVLGTLEEPVHAVNLDEVRKVIAHKYPRHFVIAIDACLGQFEHVGEIHVKDSPLHPGAGVKKELGPIGDISITGIVNVSGFMEYFVLQNTRLSEVMRMVKETVDGIVEFYEARSLQEVAAGAS